MHDALDEAERARAKRQLRPLRRAEQVRDERKRSALHVGEQQRRSPGSNYAAMNLRGLEHGIDRRRDLHQVAIAPQLIDEQSKVCEHLASEAPPLTAEHMRVGSASLAQCFFALPPAGRNILKAGTLDAIA